MAPPLKIRKEEIIKAARSLIQAKGPGALNARDLGAALGLSARPIYSHFSSMDELRDIVLEEMFSDYFAYLTRDQGTGDRFLDIGMAQIRWARMHPVEYRILQDPVSMRSGTVGSKTLSERLLDHLVGEQAMAPYKGLQREDMFKLLLPMAIFTHGLADLLTHGFDADINDADALQLLRSTGRALIRQSEHDQQKGDAS